MIVFDECEDKVTSCTLTDGTFIVGDSMAMAYKLTPTLVPGVLAASPASQSLESASAVSQQVTLKRTYVPVGLDIPVFAIVLGVIALGMGGWRKRG